MLKYLKHLFLENQIMIVLLAMVLGLLIPEPLQPLKAFSTQFLIIVFFTSSLRLSFGEIRDYARDLKLLAASNLFMLVVLPFALYMPVAFAASVFNDAWLKDWALALLIIGAMPTGMTIALIADFMGGVTSLALVMTATTSLLAPVFIPLVFKVAIGQFVPIPILSMFWSLTLTIVAPFLLAMLVKEKAPRFTKRWSEWFRGTSVLAFGLLIAGIVADSAGPNLINWTKGDLIMATYAMIWLGALTWAAYKLVSWRARAERITVALCMVYLNNTLALFIAGRFFPDANVMPKLILLLVSVNALLPPIRWEARRLIKKTPLPS